MIIQDSARSHQSGSDQLTAGLSIEDHCSYCDQLTEVRMVRKIVDLQENIISGPYCRVCTYKFVYGKIPIYDTQPQTIIELVYRYLFRDEIRSEDIIRRRIISRLF